MAEQLREAFLEFSEEMEVGLDQMRRGFATTETNDNEERPAPRRAVG